MAGMPELSLMNLLVHCSDSRLGKHWMVLPQSVGMERLQNHIHILDRNYSCKSLSLTDSCIFLFGI